MNKKSIRTKSEFLPYSSYRIEFFNKNNKKIGCLKFDKGSMSFKGSAQESAQRFFEMFLKDFVDDYILKKVARIEEAKKKEGGENREND
jgi:hypothetical protein